MLAVYGHVVTWRHLVITAVLLLLSMAALAAGVAWWAWHNLAARVVLREQQALVRLPQELSVQASLTRKVVVKVDQVLPVRVPIQQDISIPLQDPIPVQVSIDTVVPVNLTVPVKHVFKLVRNIEVVFNRPLVAPRHKDHVAYPRRIGLFDRVLDQGLVNNRQHLFGRGFSRRQKACAQTRYGENGFVDLQFLHGVWALGCR